MKIRLTLCALVALFILLNAFSRDAGPKSRRVQNIDLFNVDQAEPHVRDTIKDEVQYSIDFEGSPSIIKLIPDPAIDTAGITVSAHSLFPAEKIEAARTISNRHLYFNLNAQRPHYCYLYLNGSKTVLFVLPNDTLVVKLAADRTQTYEGKTANVNNYIREKERVLKIKDNIETKGRLSSTNPDLFSYKKIMDALTSLELKFLNDNKEKYKLPQVFIDFESAELEYFSASKINAPGYRREMMGIVEQLPENYYDFIKTVPVDNPSAVFSGYYWSYLMKLTDHHNLTDSLRKLSTPERLRILYPAEFNFYDENLRQPLRDYAYTHLLSMAISGKYIKDEEFFTRYADKISDKDARKYILNMLVRAEGKSLTPGTLAPNFELLDPDGELKGLKDYRGKVIYLSFWASWCAPCIQEFPNENKLVDRYEGKDFVVINVCKDTPKASWLALIKKHGLKTENLFVNKGWKPAMDKNYDIFSLPHYVLIDKEGKVVENKTSRPAEAELIKKIDALL